MAKPMGWRPPQCEPLEVSDTKGLQLHTVLWLFAQRLPHTLPLILRNLWLIFLQIWNKTPLTL